MFRYFYFLCIISYIPFSLAVSFKARRLVVASVSPHLTMVASDITRAGGNVFDAAVAGAFTLSVTHPYFVSIGAGGFAILGGHFGKLALDFREVAPMAVTEDFYATRDSRLGGTAVGVPGFVAGMWAIHKKYGALPWKQVLQPAIYLAERGFVVSGGYYARTEKNKDKFNPAGKHIFLHHIKSRTKLPSHRGKEVLPAIRWRSLLPGERLRQPRLAQALKLLQKGPSVFYRGILGKDLVQSVKKQGGVITKEDLKAYRVRWLRPIEWDFKGYHFYSMPLPSSGGIILYRAFRLIEGILKPRQAPDNAVMGKVLLEAFRPRVEMGDIQNKKKLSRLLNKWLSKKDLNRRAKKINKQSSYHKHTKARDELLTVAHPLRQVAISKMSPATRHHETTHFSMMDAKGNVVSMTLTLNSNYGSFVVTDKYGMVLNNQMDDFNTKVGKANQFGLIQGKNNRVRARHRPLSSMSPTIVEKNGKVILALGASGGPMIISGVFQTMVQYLVGGLDLDKAVQAPRVHHQVLPNILYVDRDRFSILDLVYLKKFFKIKERDFIARVMAVGLSKEGFLEGAFDSRGEGHAGGL